MEWRTDTGETEKGIETTFLANHENIKMLVNVEWPSRIQANFTAHILDSSGDKPEIIYFHKKTLIGLDYNELYKRTQNMVNYTQRELEKIIEETDETNWNNDKYPQT